MFKPYRALQAKRAVELSGVKIEACQEKRRQCSAPLQQQASLIGSYIEGDKGIYYIGVMQGVYSLLPY